MKKEEDEGESEPFLCWCDKGRVMPDDYELVAKLPKGEVRACKYCGIVYWRKRK